MKYIEKIAEFDKGVHLETKGLTQSHSTTDSSIADLYSLVKTYDNNFHAGKEVSPYLLNKDGTPKKVYHGTNADFTVFEKGDIGYHVGSRAQAEDRIGGEDGGHIMELYAAIRHCI